MGFMEDENFPTQRIGRFSEWLAAALFLLGLAFLHNAVGPLTRETNLAVGAALIALFIAVILPRRFETRRFWESAPLAVLLLTGFLYTVILVVYLYASSI
jgi:hypothetical protein